MTALADRLAQADVADLPDMAAAELLNAPDASLPTLTEWRKTNIGYGTIMEALGGAAGGAFLNALESLSPSVPAIKWGLRIIERGALDLSVQATREQLASLATNPPGLLTQAQVETLLALSRVVRHPSWAEHNGITVTPEAVAAARGRALGASIWLPKGYAVPGGSYVVLASGWHNPSDLVPCAATGSPETSAVSFQAAFIISGAAQ